MLQFAARCVILFKLECPDSQNPENKTHVRSSLTFGVNRCCRVSVSLNLLIKILKMLAYILKMGKRTDICFNFVFKFALFDHRFLFCPLYLSGLCIIIKEVCRLSHFNSNGSYAVILQTTGNLPSHPSSWCRSLAYTTFSLLSFHTKSAAGPMKSGTLLSWLLLLLRYSKAICTLLSNHHL